MCATTGLAHDPPPPDDGETPVIVTSDLGRELDTFLAACAEWGFSGSVVVVRDDEVILRSGYGLANRESRTPNTPDTLFEIASVTKHFTAAAVLHVEESGRLSTDDSIARWIADVPEEHAGVTIGHLLAHTSGFPRMGPSGGGEDAAAAARDYLAGGRVREPGEAFEYWNGGYALLAMIIERATGQSYQSYCREHLFEPAGMDGTGFCQEPFPDDLLTHGYEEGYDHGAASAHSYGWEYRGMGGIVMSVTDFERWDRALRDGRVLRSTKKLQTPGASGYAGGGWVEQSSRDTMQITLGGNVAGFNALAWRFPDERSLVVVLCNTSSSAFPVIMHLGRRLFDQPGFLRVPPKQVALDEVKLEALCGAYRAADGSSLVLRRDGGALHVAAEGQAAVQMLFDGRFEIPDAVRETIETAESLVRDVIDGEYDQFRALMAEGIPEDWPDRFRMGWWSQVASRGDIESIEFLGALPTAMSPSSLKTIFRLRQDQGETIVTLIFDGGRLHVFTPGPHGPVIEYRYVATSPSTLQRYWFGPGSPPAIEIDDVAGRLVLRGSGDAAITFARQDDGE
jgi:CubicO group peptidase (beta-lactamase class C family)